MSDVEFDSAGSIQSLFHMASRIGHTSHITPYTVKAFDLSGKDYYHLRVATVDTDHVSLLIQSTAHYPERTHEWGRNTEDTEGSWESPGFTVCADPEAISKSIHKKEDKVHLNLGDDFIRVDNGRASTTVKVLTGEGVPPRDLDIEPDVIHFLDRKTLIEGLERIVEFGTDRFVVEWGDDYSEEAMLFSVRGNDTSTETKTHRSFRLLHTAGSTRFVGRDASIQSPDYSCEKIKPLIQILKDTSHNNNDSDTVALSYCDKGPLFVEHSRGCLPYPIRGLRQSGCSWRYLLAPRVREE